jgi:hypothetical protein
MSILIGNVHSFPIKIPNTVNKHCKNDILISNEKDNSINKKE